jgi:hypothetical protein
MMNLRPYYLNASGKKERRGMRSRKPVSVKGQGPKGTLVVLLMFEGRYWGHSSEGVNISDVCLWGDGIISEHD